MTHARTKIAVAGLIVAVAVSYLAVAGIRKGWVYYVDVDKLLTSNEFSGQRVRVCGRVAEEGFDSAIGRLNANFVLLGKEHNIRVAYKGLVPDMFKVGSDVVIEGRLAPASASGGQVTFEADMLMTKCASKYQAEEHTKRLEPKP